ncbi:leucine-rich_repeat domain-containing protein [Hexamita inflata]|uniref:Leucine-rich repeat domain-containing protein n=1 Tax=Hexamita inflata TaxID=28002 RepID=A0AA86Q634_9EUKA|nr:leucine-rich repeat domain-containing protein [Hexamita inflata]
MNNTNINFIDTTKLLNLKELELTDNPISDINFIANLLNLEILNLKNCKLLTNISPLKNFQHLQSINISSTGVTDIWTLSLLKKLNSLSIQDTQVVDLHPLQFLFQLLELNISHSVLDLTPLQNLVNLDSLCVQFNKIQDFSPITHHKNYKFNNDDDEDQKYYLSNQTFPTPSEVRFYNKILFVHKSQNRFRTNKNNIRKFNRSFAETKQTVTMSLNNVLCSLNKQTELLMQFISISSAYID